jgi:hypothetical protein
MSRAITISASDYFGLNFSTRNNTLTLANDLGKIKNRLVAMKMDDFSYCDNLGDNVAEIDSETDHIYLDDMFFKIADHQGFSTKLGTLIHEVSHIKSVKGTGHYAKSIMSCRDLAITSPGYYGDAYKNADNWGFFIEKYNDLMNGAR